MHNIMPVLLISLILIVFIYHNSLIGYIGIIVVIIASINNNYDEFRNIYQHIFIISFFAILSIFIF